jgi:hypothetical protein
MEQATTPPVPCVGANTGPAASAKGSSGKPTAGSSANAEKKHRRAHGAELRDYPGGELFRTSGL